MVKVGDTIELIRCNDPHTRLRPGTRGTVKFVDSLGTIFVAWDNGSSLGLCEEDGDRYKIVKEG